jgi:hypothetical protein
MSQAKFYSSRLAAQAQFNADFSETMSQVLGYADGAVAADHYYVPPGGLTIDPEGKTIRLEGAQKANVNGHYTPSSNVQPVIYLPWSNIRITAGYVPNGNGKTAAEPVEEAPAPRRKKKATAPKAAKPTPKSKKGNAAATKKARSAASRAIKKAHAGVSQAALNTALTEAVKDGGVDPADADALTAYALPVVAKGQAVAEWNSRYVDDMEDPVELDADEWTTTWETLDETFEAWNDLDALMVEIEGLWFVE